MTSFHRLIGTAEPGGLLFACEIESCGRRLTVDRDSGDLTVIDHGDRAALHRGAIGGVDMPPPGLKQV
ncbi:hypothetical protein [Actinoplanes couchii]|uniref:Uncharacterized protein n=1 Tax=Actinoplanes couchii TaxID=403638 RepID=A0ABQ3XLN9_9ACTN|nr:hypothetical protein [Actinoplanes couchii]MDR6319388.1 hypothetical protein [Actinoplanes couchii]GID59401.1 hypothetical protein Aco03nite_078050 [Actinoplanes couchii]